MRRQLNTLADHATILRGRPLLTAISGSLVIASIAIVTWPAGVLGLNVAMTAGSGAMLALSYLTWVLPAVAFWLTIAITGHDTDTGIADDRHHLGLSARSDMLAGAAVALGAALLYAVVLTLLTGLAGAVDNLAHHLRGLSTPSYDPPALNVMVLLAATAAGCVLGVLLVAACAGSATRTLTVLGALLAGFALSIVFAGNSVVRTIRDYQPLGILWGSLYQGQARLLRTTGTHTGWWAAAWITVLLISAALGWKKRLR